MSCLSLTSNICRGCRDNAGGIKKIYAANVCEVDTITDATGTNDGKAISAITLSVGANWYEFVPNKNSSNWTENINASVENGTIFYEQVVTAVFGKNTQMLRDTVEEIGQSELILVVEDNNGVLWVIGEKGNGAVITGGTSASGTAWGDLNGWNLTLTCDSRVPARTLLTAPTVATECGC